MLDHSNAPRRDDEFFDDFVDHLYALSGSPNVFTGRLQDGLDPQLTWFVLKLTLRQFAADLWIEWLHRRAEEAHAPERSTHDHPTR